MKGQNEKVPYSITYKKAFKRWRKEKKIKLLPSRIQVMKTLIEYANNETGKAFPSIKTIIEETGLSKGTVDTCLDELKELGLIHRQKIQRRQGFQRNEYLIMLDEYFVGKELESADASDSPNDNEIPH